MIDTVVVARHDEAEDICTFELAAADGGPLPAFEPGAHIDVHVTPSLVRQYSLCPPPDLQGRYVIGVLREAASRGGSTAMHALQPGQRLAIGFPRNLFALAPHARRSLLFAGGIGITPLLAMAEHLALARQDFDLHYCTRSIARTAFVERLRHGLAAPHTRFHHDASPAAQRLALDATLGAPQPETHVYACGPAGFMAWVLDGAAARGWPAAQLHKEYFTAAVGATGPAGGERAFEVVLARSGRTCTVPPGRSVVQVLAEAGVVIPVSCEQGVCGTCLTRVIDGTPGSPRRLPH